MSKFQTSSLLRLETGDELIAFDTDMHMDGSYVSIQMVVPVFMVPLFSLKVSDTLYITVQLTRANRRRTAATVLHRVSYSLSPII